MNLSPEEKPNEKKETNLGYKQQYANQGMNTGTIIAVIAVILYVLSSCNPSRGSFLSWEQILIIFCIVAGFSLGGALIGYVLGSLAEFLSKRGNP